MILIALTPEQAGHPERIIGREALLMRCLTFSSQLTLTCGIHNGMTVRKLFLLPELQPWFGSHSLFSRHHLGRTSFLFFFYYYSAQRTLFVKEFVQAWWVCAISHGAGGQHLYETSCSNTTVFFYLAMLIEHTHKKILSSCRPCNRCPLGNYLLFIFFFSCDVFFIFKRS